MNNQSIMSHVSLYSKSFSSYFVYPPYNTRNFNFTKENLNFAINKLIDSNINDFISEFNFPNLVSNRFNESAQPFNQIFLKNPFTDLNVPFLRPYGNMYDDLECSSFKFLNNSSKTNYTNKVEDIIVGDWPSSLIDTSSFTFALKFNGCRILSTLFNSQQNILTLATCL